MISGEQLGWTSWGLAEWGGRGLIRDPYGALPSSFCDPGRAEIPPAQWDVGHSVGMEIPSAWWDVGHSVGISLQVKISYYDHEGHELAVAWLYLTCVGRCPLRPHEFQLSWDLAGSTRSAFLGDHRQ